MIATAPRRARPSYVAAALLMGLLGIAALLRAWAPPAFTVGGGHERLVMGVGDSVYVSIGVESSETVEVSEVEPLEPDAGLEIEFLGLCHGPCIGSSPASPSDEAAMRRTLTDTLPVTFHAKRRNTMATFLITRESGAGALQRVWGLVLHTDRGAIKALSNGASPIICVAADDVGIEDCDLAYH